MPHVPALLTLPAPSPPPAAQLRLALMATHHAPLGPVLPPVLPAHIQFLRDLLGAGPTFPAALGIGTAIGAQPSEADILRDIGRPLAAPPPPPPGGAAPPPNANVDIIRDPSARNDFHVTPLRRNGEVTTVRQDLMVRSSPTTATSTNIFAHLANGTHVFVVGQFGDWYAIEQPGRTGFVASRYLRLL
jgi:hypothetical protein